MTNTEKILSKNIEKLYAWYLFYKELYAEKGEEEAKLKAKLEVLDLANAKIYKKTKKFASSSEVWAILTRYCPEMAI